MTAADELTITVHTTDHLSAEAFAGVKRLFAENYRDANLAYLEKALGTLRFIATALTPNGEMAGFALGEARMIDLPRLPASKVHLAGLSCVGMGFRRQKLFGRLEQLALAEAKLPLAERSLSCGRCAHPASFRNFFRNPAAVPHAGRVPTEWQREIGIAIAEAYRSPGFDAATFVVQGSGSPIGWPVIEIEATPEEWAMFEPVDRSKGDSLLGIAWNPAPPDGWQE